MDKTTGNSAILRFPVSFHIDISFSWAKQSEKGIKQTI